MSEKFNPFIEDPTEREQHRQRLLETSSHDFYEAHEGNVEQCIETIIQSLGWKPGTDPQIDQLFYRLRMEFSYIFTFY